MSQPSSSQTLYRLFYALAAVSCAFSLLVGILLVSNMMAVRLASPLNLPELDHLRAALKTTPADDSVREKIRDMDQVVRHLYFTGLTSRRTGGYLLLAGIAVSLVCLKTVGALRRRQPDPRDYPATPDRLQAEAVARWTLAGVGIFVLGSAAYLGFANRGIAPAPAAAPVAGTAASPAVASAPNPVSVPNPEALSNWPSFRGPNGCGVALCTNPPVSWMAGGASGILWKAEIPLPGMSSPVVSGNRVYLTGANDEKRQVYCFDIASGTRLWTVDVKSPANPPKKAPDVFKDTGFAAPTAVTDGRMVCALFANGDLTAMDPCAQPMWTVDLGLTVNQYGHSSSLALFNGKVLIQYDQKIGKGNPSRLIAVDAMTGKTVWSTPRPVSASWPSPIVVETAKGPQLITVANEAIIAYDPATGRELWTVKCTGADVAPSPTFAGGLVIVSVTGDKVYAIRPDGSGDVTATHVAWALEEGVSDVPSPVGNNELVFLPSSSGMLLCVDVKTGAKVWEQSIDAEFYGSPGLAGDRLYLVARNGTVYILKAGRKFEELGKIPLDEPSDGSPVFAGNRLLIRGVKTLFCLGGTTK